MSTTPPTITPLPTPVPQRSDPANFATRGDLFLTALPTFQTELQGVADNAYSNAVDAEAAADSADLFAQDAAAHVTVAEGFATAAQVSAISAAQAAGAAAWAAGSYPTGAVVYSPTTGLTYRRRAPGGASATDPASDPAGWFLAVVAAPRYVPEAGATVNAVVNTEHGLQNAGVVNVVLPDPGTLAVGDTIWVSVENGRQDNYLTLTGAVKFNGELQDSNQLLLDDPYARLNLRWSGPTYGWSG